MKKELKILFILILVSIFWSDNLITPKFALADGMVIALDPYSDRWDYLDESHQQAFINYENGLEKMILSIGINKRNAVWIFPVPAEPNKVAIDIIAELPQLKGEEITGKAKSILFFIKGALSATQIYPIPFVIQGIGKMPRRESFPPTMGEEKPTTTDVTVYEHLEKEGIITEIITAKSAQALYRYLQNKNLKIEQGSIPVLDYYIGKEFTFVVSWISDIVVVPESQIKQQGIFLSQKELGVFVTFPTQKIYYPLLPTSVYGNKIIPIEIRIIGHRTPEIFKEIKKYTKIEYFIADYFNSKGLKSFYGDSIENIKYTKIEIQAPSEFFRNDLWISSRRPFRTYFSLLIAQHPLFIGIILLILSSAFASSFAGWVVFKDLRNKNGILKLALTSLSNCFSLIGLAAATILLETKPKHKKAALLLKEAKEKGYRQRRRLATVLFFAISPFLTLGIILLPFLFFNIISYGIPPLELVIYIYIIPLSVLALALFLKKVKPEDKPLFDQLKLLGYSSWSFHSKDRMKLAFVPLFSVSFLIVSWLIVKLIEFTL